MFRSLISGARNWPVVWRSRLLFYWFTLEKDSFGFIVMISLPVSLLAVLIYFAHGQGARVEATQQIREAAHQRSIELQCLAENVYFEARGEPMDGQYAVAEVTLNRVASGYFPDTVCEVVHETRWDPSRKRQVAAFSWTDLGPMRRPRGDAWDQAVAAATAAYDGVRTPQVPGALYYHATYIDPYWAKTKTPIATIGNHAFYR